MVMARKHSGKGFFENGDIESHEREIILNCTGEIVRRECSNVSPVVTRKRNDFYLMYLLSGELYATVGDKSFPFAAGDVLLIPPRAPHRYERTNTEVELRYLWMHFTGSKCEDLVTSCGITPATAIKIGLHNDIIARFDELCNEFISRDKSFYYSTASIVQQILISIGRCVSRLAPAAPKLLSRSLEYIHANLKEKITVEALAEMEYISTSRYRQLFAEKMGKSPIEYITSQRIYRACELMAQEDITIADIAEMCGYPDRLYFQRVFKKVMGTPPGEYRMKLHGKGM